MYLRSASAIKWDNLLDHSDGQFWATDVLLGAAHPTNGSIVLKVSSTKNNLQVRRGSTTTEAGSGRAAEERTDNCFEYFPTRYTLNWIMIRNCCFCCSSIAFNTFPENVLCTSAMHRIGTWDQDLLLLHTSLVVLSPWVTHYLSHFRSGKAMMMNINREPINHRTCAE